MKRSTKRWLGAIVVLAIVAGLAYANFAYRKKTGKEVTVEAVQARDLTAIVSASGKSRPSGPSTSVPTTWVA